MYSKVIQFYMCVCVCVYNVLVQILFHYKLLQDSEYSLLCYTVSWSLLLVAVAQSQNRVPVFATPWTAACQTPLSFTLSRSLLKLMLIESMMPSNHLILCHPLLLSSIFPSIRVSSHESALCVTWPKLQLQHQSFQWMFRVDFLYECSGLISFRMDWFDLPAVWFYLTTIQKHQLFDTQPSLWSSSHIHTWLLEKS